jgi:glucose/mannose transport system substrate-binding protein
MRARRPLTVLAASLAASSLLLGACSSPTTIDDVGAGGDTTEVEVYTWWASGSEKAGLDALVKVFEEQNPETKFVNGAIAGGAGSAAKELLQSRLQVNDPPDTFQAHAGAELSDYITAGQLEDVSYLYDRFGLRDAFPQSLIDRLTVEGRIYSVPSNIHRANVVWANPDVIEDAGLDADATYDDLDAWFDALEKVKKSGATPLAIATTWTQVQLFETVLLADLGPDGYTALWEGGVDWAGPEVTEALEDFETLMSYTNTDRDGLDWGDATQMVIDGKAAFNVMGDWAEAAFQEAGASAPDDYLYFPVPGTDGVFDFLADSFTLPVGARHLGGTEAWLGTISSLDGQIAFNRAKGSIPARHDVPPTDFAPYQQAAMESFGQDVIVSSLAHGAAAPTATVNAITDAVSKFTSGASDLETFQADLVAANAD